jgi:hypothetical protein
VAMGYDVLLYLCPVHAAQTMRDTPGWNGEKGFSDDS